VIPQAALARDEQGAYVLVVGKDGKVAQRRLKVQEMTRSEWIVTGDLGDGDRVIVEGLQKVHPGTTAKPVPASTTPAGSTDNA
jgi:membrane fusion protein (multidrug efflux system)